MPPKVPQPITDQGGRFIDTESGLWVPESYTRSASVMLSAVGDSAINARGFNQGLALDRDPNTLAVKWPRKGSGLDDFTSQAIVDGDIANVGVSPVIAPQIAAMVRRQQNLAITASVELAGRQAPTQAAKEALLRFDDSPLGVSSALEKIVYGICTFNRGAPIALIPITHSPDVWADEGLYLKPILKGRSKKTNTYWLDVDWTKLGTPVPYLPSVYNLEATGIPNFPYWYRTILDGRAIWVLLHKTQILQVLPGVSGQSGIGTSSVWMCLGTLAESILFTDERVEKMLYALTDGLIVLGGVKGLTGAKIKEEIVKSRTEAIENGFAVARGSTIITSPMDSVSMVQVNFRQNPGVSFSDWQEYTENVTSFCFNEALSTMVIRGGVGYGAQADANQLGSADSGIGSMLHRVGLALGAIYPRVQVSLIRPGDRSQRTNVSMLSSFATAIHALPPNTLTREEVRGIIDRDIVDIPQVGHLNTSANTEEDVTDVGPNPTNAPANTVEPTQPGSAPIPPVQNKKKSPKKEAVKP